MEGSYKGWAVPAATRYRFKKTVSCGATLWLASFSAGYHLQQMSEGDYQYLKQTDASSLKMFVKTRQGLVTARAVAPGSIDLMTAAIWSRWIDRDQMD